MRLMLATLALGLAAGCSSPAESHGTTAKEYGGTVPIVFINATPERLCGLYISYDNEPDYGDNWLPIGGLPVGQSLELKIKPGTYKAKWNTCKDARDRPTISYAATLVGGTAIPIEGEPLQLYAFVSDGVPPTKRGVPRPRMKMIKFIGQVTEIAVLPPEPPPGEQPPEAAPVDQGPPVVHKAEVGPMPPMVWIPRIPVVVIAPPAPPPVAPAPPPAPPPTPPPAPAPAPPPVAPAPPPAAPGLGPPGSTLFKPK
jgi:hypothetical protein